MCTISNREHFDHFRMFTQELLLVTLLTFLHPTLQLGIDLIPASDTDGLIFKEHKKTFVQTSTRYVTYKFNISNLNYIDINRDYVEQSCPTHKTRLQIFDQASLNISPVYELTTNYSVLKPNGSVFQPSEMLDLNSLIDQFQRGDCSLLENILNSIIKLKTTFSNLALNNTDFLFDVIDRSRFQSDVLIASKISGYSTPLSHQLFYSEVWKYVKFHYQFKNNIVYTEFEIPLFSAERTSLLSIFSKPIIHDNNAYIFNMSDVRYTIITEHSVTTYTEKSYQERCHSSLGIYFCLSEFNRNSCFNRFIHSNNPSFSDECFIKLKNSNMITQIGKDIHFTIFTPLNIDLIWGQYSLASTIPFSSYINGKISCNISTPFFTYSTLGPEKYEVFSEQKVATVNLRKNFYNKRWDVVFVLLAFIAIIAWIICFSIHG